MEVERTRNTPSETVSRSALLLTTRNCSLFIERKGIHVMLVAMAGASMMTLRILRYLSRYLARWYTAAVFPKPCCQFSRAYRFCKTRFWSCFWSAVNSHTSPSLLTKVMRSRYSVSRVSGFMSANCWFWTSYCLRFLPISFSAARIWRIFFSVGNSGMGSTARPSTRSLMPAALCGTLSNSRGAYCFSLNPYELFTNATSSRDTTFCEVMYLRRTASTFFVVSFFLSHSLPCSFVAFSGGFWLRNFVTNASALAMCLFSLACAFNSYMYLASLYSNSSSSSLSILFVSRIRSKRSLCFIALASLIRFPSSSAVMNSSALYVCTPMWIDLRKNTIIFVLKLSAPMEAKASGDSFVWPTIQLHKLHENRKWPKTQRLSR